MSVQRINQAEEDDWIASHFILQDDVRRRSAADIVRDFMPERILRQLAGKFVMVCRPPDSAATVIRPEKIRDRFVVVVSKYLIPVSNPPTHFPREYTALILMHELAHIQLEHSPPTTDGMENEAYELALEWYNETQATQMTMDDLTKLNEQHDGFWLNGL